MAREGKKGKARKSKMVGKNGGKEKARLEKEMNRTG